MACSARRTAADGGSPRSFMRAGRAYVGPSPAMTDKTWMKSRTLYTAAGALGEAGPAEGLGRFGQQPDDEGAEVGVDGGDLVEAHLVEDLLERQRVIGQEGDAPLPVVEGEGARDQLQHPAGVGHADAGVATHEPAPILERELVPVGLPRPPLGHRVEADQLL